MMGTEIARGVLVAFTCGVLSAVSAAGQAPTIRGQVVDAEDGRALPGATVTLEPYERGVMAPTRDRSSPAVALRRITDERGHYSFDELAAGRYRLRVERIGYRGASLEVTLGRAGVPQMTLGLDVKPIALRPLTVDAGARRAPDLSAAMSFGQPLSYPTLSPSTLPVLELDAVALDTTAVRSAVALGESDLLRALQRTPGVTTRDEYAAELWTRGSPWGHTRVYLDDLPVLDPFLGGGALTAISPMAVSGVFFHPGARSVSLGEGAAGVARIATKDASDRPGLPFLGELGIGTMQGSVERRFLGGRAGLVASGRRSWYDYIWNTFVDDGHDPEGPFDYSASSSLLRMDWAVGANSRLVASRFRSADDLRGNAAAVVSGSVGSWGAAVDQLSWSTGFGRHAVRLFGGRSNHRVGVAPDAEAWVRPVDPRVVLLPEIQGAVQYRQIGVEWTPPAGDARATRLGVSLVGQRAEGSGGAAAAGAEITSVRVGSLWAESQWRRGRWGVHGGLRIEAGGGGFGDGATARSLPHLALRFTPRSDVTLSVAARKTAQYLQQVGPAGRSFAGGHAAGHVWIASGEAAPVLESDIVTMGAEMQVTTGLWLSGTAWTRRARGVVLPDPTPGTFPVWPRRWVAAESRATGGELQLRGSSGAWTGHGSYSLLRSRDHIDRESYPSFSGRTHVVDALVTYTVRNGLSFGGALVAQSGAPYARVVQDACLEPRPQAPNPCTGVPSETHEPRSDLRSPGYSSVDLSMDWTRRRETWGIGIAAQLRNVLAVRNEGGYRGTGCLDGLAGEACLASPQAVDRFQSQVRGPFPFITLRVWF